MCGIAGIAGRGVDPELVRRMTAILAHRGPDDEGVWLLPDGRVGLGARRLAIIDLTPAGHMPMANGDGSVVLVYNGEIYNFQALRAELAATGVAFRSRTDTEVLLAAWERWGAAMLPRLNGMFAFALWDARRNVLFAARDRLGIKPLYYTITPGGDLAFASEVKALLVHPEVPRRLNRAALDVYLSLLWVPGPATMFEGIHKLPPAHSLTWRDGALTIERYWDPWAVQPRHDLDYVTACARLRTTADAAVERQLVADVPVGLMLSGGLDSTAILAFAARHAAEPVRSYTIVFRRADQRWEQNSDDARYAREAARAYGSRLQEIEVAPDAVSVLRDVVWHMDEPVADPAAINTLLIAREAVRDVKVLLSGQGADELFGGYASQRAYRWAAAWRLLPRPARRGLVGGATLARHVAARVPALRPGIALAVERQLMRLDRATDAPAGPARYHALRSYLDRNSYDGLLLAEDGRHVAACAAAWYAATLPAVFDTPAEVMLADLTTFLPDLNLLYGDKMTSAASVEMRVPLLDNEVVDFALATPASWRIRGLTGKRLLRDALRGVVPDPVIRRRKAAFGAPVRSWLRHELAPTVDEFLGAAQVARRGLFSPDVIWSLVAEHRAGLQDHTYVLWALLTLEIWQQTFLDRVPVAPLEARSSATSVAA